MTDVGDAFRSIKAQLIDRTGHHYYADKDDQLRERMGQRLAATGAGSLVDYLRLLEGPGGEAEWRRLESAVTINETFFFRFAEQFAALRQHVVPALVAARAEQRRLRFWSAGCSTGAEAFSLAVVVHEVLGHRLPDWQVSILGTDIDEGALEAARSGRFGSWALRSVTEEERETLFVSEGRHFTICPQYRALVRFERHNLLSLEEGGALQLCDFDLILCRNVLIYFSVDRAERIAAALACRLAPDGWLFLGHAEPGPAAGRGVNAVPVGNALAYRLAAAADPSPRSQPPVADIVPTTEPIASRPPRPARRPARREPASVPLPATDITAIRSALDLGLVDDAERQARARIDADPLDARAHFLLALACAGLGRIDDADAALGRVLYLEPGLVMGHYLRGVLADERGRTADARLVFAAAQRQLAGLPEDAVVEEGDGMTVSDLTAAIRWRLARAAA